MRSGENILSDNDGRMVWRILFSIIMASLLVFVFVIYYNSQQRANVSGEAQGLADSLAKSSFSALSTGQNIYQLPEDVGGSPYSLEISENRNIIKIKITGGDQKGELYVSSVNADISAENLPEIGNRVYITNRNGDIVFSKMRILPTEKNIFNSLKSNPSKFYKFSRENTKISVAIIGSYFYGKSKYPEKDDFDIVGYGRKNENVFLIRASDGDDFSTNMEVEGKIFLENDEMVEKIWIVENISLTDKKIENMRNCPSIKESYSSGWTYSSKQVLKYLRGRAWEWIREKENIQIPENVEISSSLIYNKNGEYPAYRVSFEEKNQKFNINYQSMPFYYRENKPGFLFWSIPRMEPIS